ncbi:hypothetical protein GKC30_08300 [Pseudodesulfovibrio sp. F-1]|uniref:Transcriptional regulator, TetR family n=1 Tax=Pseudodesulfovibrio alkaliphilus TaxID=2661613 RepID=A0A7K1KP15_9BACT|nr:TetR/AcrR family transcriptional regulator [Pseudodesulfovibrio alkaliphilus]MUM77631.1 hypothetical protein [Pseudodesulfovibrio alkaliphilus]
MADKRDELLDAACERFRASDLKGLHLESLARQVGLSPQQAREMFPDSDGLNRAVYERALIAMAAESVASLPGSGIGRQLEHLLRQRYGFLVDHRESSRDILFGVISAGGGWRDPFEDQFWRFSVQVVALLEAAKRNGEIRADADHVVAARAFVSYYLTGILLALRNDTTSADQACDFTFPLVSALLESLR